jgi:hypothetical protein
LAHACRSSAGLVPLFHFSELISPSYYHVAATPCWLIA